MYSKMFVIFSIMVLFLLNQSSGTPHMSCKVSLAPTMNTGIGQCDVTKLHRQGNPYTCTWVQTNEISKQTKEIARKRLYNLKDHGSHFSGKCSAIFSITKDLSLKYEVLLLPDGLRVTARKEVYG
ncbi:uncharacterized protein LOC112569464 [Pomacea canaliculata]|uniref:uncharacterized protein LOC112569464 n=1 Tax=Pomacea canaliculata TaxID=400727 RepID=UPI000D7363B9|nr:uncharacterized protein LOC112569464 [Pomacea canaliculata]